VRILDNDNDKKLDTVGLFLTKEELIQLKADIDSLIQNPKNQHTHLSSEDYQKEITVCIYDPKNLEGLHDRCKFLIEKDE